MALLLAGASVASGSAGLPTPRLSDRDAVERYFRRPDRRLVIEAGLTRAGLYWDAARGAAVRYGVPEDLFFGLALVESAFYPYARSTSGAEGLWQFLPETGREYGLEHPRDRFDVVKSSGAAARYLRDLWSRFGCWDLALAAYNAGPGVVERAIRLSGTSQWERVGARLRDETFSFVPKIRFLAETLYAPFVRREMRPPDLVLVEAGPGDTWFSLARRYGLPQADLRLLNNGLLVEGAPLVVPAGRYEVQEGDTAFSIAQRLGIEVADLTRMNELGEEATITRGQTLLVPLPAAVGDSGALESGSEEAPARGDEASLPALHR